jgi:hypothetical protein
VGQDDAVAVSHLVSGRVSAVAGSRRGDLQDLHTTGGCATAGEMSVWGVAGFLEVGAMYWSGCRDVDLRLRHAGAAAVRDHRRKRAAESAARAVTVAPGSRKVFMQVRSPDGSGGAYARTRSSPSEEVHHNGPK